MELLEGEKRMSVPQSEQFDEIELNDLFRSIKETFQDPTITEAFQEDGDYEVYSTQYNEERLKDMGFNLSQIEEIKKGLIARIPVDVYAKEYYTWQQMHVLRLALQDKVDISLFSAPSYSAEQMHEIRLGVMQGIDVSAFAKSNFTPESMRNTRRLLLSNRYNQNPTGHEMVYADDEYGIIIHISDDCMSAYVTMTDKNFRYSLRGLQTALNKYDVSFGIMVPTLLKMVLEGEIGTEYKIAQGEEALPGDPGYYEYFFERETHNKPQILEDGRADYTNTIVAPSVDANQLLMIYHPGEKGRNGRTVTDYSITATKGVDLYPYKGSGFYKGGEDGNSYFATKRGCVGCDDKTYTINIWNVYTVDGNVNRYTGRISFDGTIEIHGSVLDMAVIEATGDIIIDGFVESAIVKAGGNVIIRCGINAGGKGYIRAGGSIVAKFIESAKVMARDNIEANYFLNSYIETDGLLKASGKKSMLVGGNVFAAEGIEVRSIMSNGKTKTNLQVGDLMWINNRLLQQEQNKAKVVKEIRQLEDGKNKVLLVTEGSNPEDHPLYGKIKAALEQKLAEHQLYEIEIGRLNGVKRKAMRAYIKITDQIAEDVIITMGNVKRKVNTPIKAGKITQEYLAKLQEG